MRSAGKDVRVDPRTVGATALTANIGSAHITTNSGNGKVDTDL
jgi:hypothetical protein